MRPPLRRQPRVKIGDATKNVEFDGRLLEVRFWSGLPKAKREFSEEIYSICFPAKLRIFALLPLPPK